MGAKNSDVIAVLRDLICDPRGCTVLDLGCGLVPEPFNRQDEDLLTYFANRGASVIGVDIWEPVIDWRRKHGPEGTYIRHDVCTFELLAADTVILHHVLEHLDKREGLRLLADVIDLGIPEIIVGAPDGVSDNTSAVEATSNPYQRHQSAWYPDELKLMGFAVIQVQNVFVAYRRRIP